MTRSLIPLALFCLPLAGCGGGTPEQPPLAGARVGGPFALTDGNGRTVRDTDFTGRYRIVYFGYTYCPDVCPTDMQKIGQAMKILDKDAPRTVQKVVPIFISVDPERDTPTAVKQFVANFDPRAVGLTGTPDQIAQVAKNYAVYYKKQPPSPSGGYMVDHFAAAYLMGPNGEPLALLPLEKGGAAIAQEVRHWVR
ncbi:SCO family protein [Sphingomonas xinjiangensis]|uniref:Protein SCO1/2 n=1 Tax=Sphingomonas xinjiangensis TaxID=643568 RepID=A0A840YE42_9SPHN|nr:SCO family protein [Sphingomonas xinjiangensis]MBB5711114.1 protein SCO1/2 [Sphingomonas xinjiangensis]